MQRRKERVEDKQSIEKDGDFNLRNVVAEARVVAAQEDVVAKQERRASAGKMSKLGPPASPTTKTKPGHVVENPRAERKASEPNRPSRASFSTTEFVPPPPVLYREKSHTDNTQSQPLPVDTADKIIEEQRKQQQLLLEHQKQLALLERLEQQKLELDRQKRDFEAQQQRQQQAMLLEKQKELERQIQSQQDQLKANEERLEQQKLFMTNFAMMQSQFIHPTVNPQVPMMPISGIPAAAPAYMPSAGGMQPIYGNYPAAAMLQAGMPQMMSGAVTMPTTVNTSVPTAHIQQR